MPLQMILLIFLGCYIYAFYKFDKEATAGNLAGLILTGSCGIFLGTKMGYIVIGLTTFFYSFHIISQSLKNKKRLLRMLILFILGGAVILSGKIYIAGMIEDIFERGTRMLSNSNGLMSFLTSGRVDRIHPAYLEGVKTDNLLHLLFGWRAPLDGFVVEMDFIDAFFQFGIIGLIIAILTYLNLTLRLKSQSIHMQYMYYISMIYAVFGGHIISAAVAGTVFGLVYSLRIVYADRTVPAIN